MSARNKILVVDDEDDIVQLIRQKFRRQIREHEFEFVFAENGVEALSKLQEHPDIDLVFSDINMPKMDGLTLLTKITEDSPLLKTVIISAYGDMPNIRTAMNRGAFDFICKPFDFEDFQQTLAKAIQSVNQIKRTLQAVQENDILKMYVDDSVLRFMTQKEYESSVHATENVDASILFADISGFTAISEREPPDAVITLLNQYFDVMVKAIIAEDGYVDKFMGDAILAVFRGDGHLQRALRAALAINENTKGLENPLPDTLATLPEISIGVNAGEVIAGNIGSATLRRFDFTVIGDVVNTAQRLQSAAKPGQILITQETYEGVKDQFDGKQIGEVGLKNKSNPVLVFEVVGKK